MGVQVAVTLDDMQKPSYVVSTVLAASFLLADTDMVIWIGNAHGGGKHFEVTGIKRCLEFIRENGTVTPTGLNESYAEVAAPGFKKDVNGAFDAAAALPEEIKVGIWYGPLFQPLPGSTITPHVHRALEKYLETTQKVT
jgi:hypothetical protein